MYKRNINTVTLLSTVVISIMVTMVSCYVISPIKCIEYIGNIVRLWIQKYRRIFFVKIYSNASFAESVFKY